MAARQWLLEKFPVQRFRHETRAQVKEPALMVWDDSLDKPQLILRAGRLVPLLLVNLDPRAMPGFERQLARLKQEDSQASSLALSLLEEASGRRLQFIGTKIGSDRLLVKFGFYLNQASRQFQPYGRVWVRFEKRGRRLILIPERAEFDKRTAALLWSLLRGSILDKIHSRIEKAKRQLKNSKGNR